MDDISIIEDLFITEEELQFFHAFFNAELFNNQLSPVFIRIEYPGEEAIDEMIGGAFYSGYDPHLIVIFEDPDDEAYLVQKDFILCILLHEMVHQYCFEKGILDVDNGKHTQAFFDEANKHGLDGGYSFSQRTKEITSDMLLHRSIVKGVREKFLHGDFDCPVR